MYDGLEIDMLSVGDADCLVITEWAPSGPWRILVDGGKASDAKPIKEFLLARGFTYFWAIVCSHLHNDHAAGLIELVKDPRFTFTTAWMHDIRNHFSSVTLRDASTGNSAQAGEVKQILETTRELASAFQGRNVTPQQPFSGSFISASRPNLVVVGPSLPFYESALAEFTKTEESADTIPPWFWSATAALGGAPTPSQNFGAPPFHARSTLGRALFAGTQAVPALGALSNSSVKENPKTQPFNNTSTILGAIYNGHRLLFTADAGAEALDQVPPEWKALLWLQAPHHGSDGNLSQKNIERFCPQNAFVSACGDSSHPSRAIVSGLIKCGAQVFSTHQNPHHLWFHVGEVPNRSDYGPAVAMRGTGSPEPVFNPFAIPWPK